MNLCPICAKHTCTLDRQICDPCTERVRSRLRELPALHAEAHNCLLPQRGGHGTNTGEPTLGVNLTALDFVSGRAILDLLHGWERVIREDRGLVPPALVAPQGSVEAEIDFTVRFHTRHLDWTVTQPMAEDFAREVAEVHALGTMAARRFVDPVRRITCPADHEDGQCGNVLGVSGSDLLEHVTCRRCGTNWTVARLVAVAMTAGDGEIWLDTESIAGWVGISEEQVRRIARSNKLERRGQLLELHNFLNARRVAV